MTDERLKIWLSFLKFFLGAAGISLVTTIVNWQIQQQELQINLRNAELEYLERFSKGALNEDLFKRRSFAQYFSTVTISKESRVRWKEYLIFIENEIKSNKIKIHQKKASLIEKTKDTISEENKIVSLKKQLSKKLKEQDRSSLKLKLAESNAKLELYSQDLQLEREELLRLKSEISTSERKYINNNKQIPTHFIGNWEGSGIMADITEKWAIKIILDANNGQIEYPSLKCGGILHLQDVLNSNQLKFTETILIGAAQCSYKGSIILTKTSKNEIEYRWFYPSGKVGAKGILIRK